MVFVTAERVLLLELFAVLVQQVLATAELREFLQLFPTGKSVMVGAWCGSLAGHVVSQIVAQMFNFYLYLEKYLSVML